MICLDRKSGRVHKENVYIQTQLLFYRREMIWNSNTGRRVDILATCRISSLNHFDIFSLQAFRAAANAKFDFLVFFQRLVTAGINDTSIVNENVGAGLLLNKAEALIGIKPFYGASRDCRHV